MKKLTETDLAWQRGFEDGIYYAFGHIDSGKLTDEDLSRFASWIELKRPWKSFDEWYDMIKKASSNRVKNTPYYRE